MRTTRLGGISQFLVVVSVLLGGGQARQAEAELPLDIAAEVLSPEQREVASGMIERDIVRRTAEVNARNREAWSKIKTRADWEQFCDERIDKLRQSLAEFPPVPEKLTVRTTGVVPGDGFQIENVVYESRPGLWVTANLYVPSVPRMSMPGLLIAHAHHRDKPQSELQDMGMTWARAGCLVLVIDQVGYGERRSHPFHRESDFAKPFAVSRQDYFFRYDTGVQLQLLGDSLMGWMAWDLMRGVDLLLAREGVDPQRIILLGAVAGGGDPAGVTTALDHRITCCVPFNYGGPQPESKYPLPEDSETSFNYLSGSYWESTRGLRLGGRDDFLHWVIVGSTAPRYLIHAHEFSWDGERDPVWKRYQKIWGDFYQAGDRLGIAHGYGLLRQNSDEASHCTNIGPPHRKMIHPLFQRWFGIQVTPELEYSQPRTRDELRSMTDLARKELHPQSLTQVMSRVADERIALARKQLAGKTPVERRLWLQSKWSQLLGPIVPARSPVVQLTVSDAKPPAGMRVERVVLEVESGIVVPLLLLIPEKRSGRSPVVIGLAQAGKAGFLKHRSPELMELVRGGAVVVLPDLRGTGESRSGSSRGKESEDTNLSCNVQLFGETLVGQRLRDMRSVIAYLRDRSEVDVRRLALWGDSFTPPNPPETNFRVPHGVEGWPTESEPLGGLLALLGALFEEDVRAVSISGGLASYRSALTHFTLVIPHDAVVPGALSAGDLIDLATGLSPRPLRLTGMVNSVNRPVQPDELEAEYTVAVAGDTHPEAVEFADDPRTAASWLLDKLR
jgi:cephalosporin-C deacetylase-like acetyl esterase